MQADNGLAPQEPFDVALFEHYSGAPNWPRYRKLVKLGADAGDPLALYAVASWYLFGELRLGITKDTARGIVYLKRAAGTLNRAMYELGVCFATGDGVPIDPRAAYRLFVRAAALGCLPAMTAQAHCLSSGFGVRRDLNKGEEVKRRAKALQRRLRPLISTPARETKRRTRS